MGKPEPHDPHHDHPASHHAHRDPSEAHPAHEGGGPAGHREGAHGGDGDEHIHDPEAQAEQAIEAETNVGAGAGHGAEYGLILDTAQHGAIAREAMEHGAHAGHPAPEGAHAAHVDHTGHEAMFRRRFWVSLVLSIPVLLYSPMLQEWLGFTAPPFPGSQWIGSLFAVIVFLYGGVPFLQMAVPELQNRQPGMMTLISLAITVAFVYSLAALFIRPGGGFFWELVTLIDVMLLGHWMEMRSVRQASRALDELARLMPDTAERIGPDGRVEQVPVERLRAGDRVLVRPGASIPADGAVVEGESDVNEAMITGESRPVKKVPGAEVIAGTVNGDGSLRVLVTAVGEETALAGITRLVQEAQQSKSRTQLLADRARAWLFYIALGVAAVTAGAWIVATGFNVQVVERVATVLVIACPHALGLAVPLVVAITTSMAAGNGVLIRDRMALEQAREVDIVIFDKTGTLTKGEQGVVGVATVEGWDEARALALAAAIEGDSEHIIARAIREAAEGHRLPLAEIGAFEALKGRGVRAKWNSHAVYVGGPRLLEMLGLTLPPALARFAEEAGSKGQTTVYLAQDEQVVAALALADVIRPESKAAVQRLHEMRIQVAMLTGDSEEVAKAVAEELEIDLYFAEVLPENKDQKVADLQAQGKKVAMVGDGVNDAPALVRADVGIAIGSGTDVAVESAGIILVRSNPLDVVKIVELSRASYRKMIQNLLWATGYNVVALPLAAGILAPVGILLSPAIGALFMSLSTIIVAINAQLLRRVQLGGSLAS
ncbi:MAG: copper-translocating P-type ATPase [Ardenticatenaceae bacterium]|nr:copper-translocating P-type ATPase [Ardenticatenaceae bacterium]